MTQAIGIYDHESGQQIIRDMTTDELSKHQEETVKYLASRAKVESENQEAKEALLSTLNITEKQAVTLGLLKPVINLNVLGLGAN